MAMFPAFLDTCTLYGAYLCDSLLRLAEAGTYRPLWSADVLDELERALVARGLEQTAVTHRVYEMRRAFPDAEVRGYENLVGRMTCDPKDRHMLAAAVRSDAAPEGCPILPFSRTRSLTPAAPCGQSPTAKPRARSY